MIDIQRFWQEKQFGLTAGAARACGYTVLDIEELVKNHSDYLYGFAMSRVRNEEVAHDLIQEALLVAVRKADDFKGLSQPRVWLVGILKNKIFEYFRNQGRANKFHTGDDISELQDVLGDDSAWPDAISPRGIPSPHEALERKELAEALHNCIAELPQRSAQVYSLYELEQLPSEEICNMLQLSSTNLRVMIHRARFKLRACLEKIWLK